MSQTQNIAIIPARGGSKRLPGKNLELLGDHPLLAHSILYARGFPDIIHKVVVSTDHPGIAQVAANYGAEVVNRPADLAGDHEPVITALKHVLTEQQEEYRFVFLLQPTNPLRPADLLPKAYECLINQEATSLVTVSPLKEKFGTIQDKRFKPSNYSFGQRSQDLLPLYRENGLLYISSSQEINAGNILSENNCPYLTHTPLDRIDIDTREDLELARMMYNQSKPI